MSSDQDIVGKIAGAVRKGGHAATEGIVRFFSIWLAITAWIGAAFLKDLLWPTESAKPWWMVPLGLFILAVGVVSVYLQARDSSQTNSLRKRNGALAAAIESFGDDYRGIWTYVLYRWATALNFDGGHRISIYKHEGRDFIMIARYSENATIAARGRAVYPDNQGCIGAAWASNDGTAFANNFPTFDGQPSRYRSRHRLDWGMPEEAVTLLTMKPRAILAIALADDSGMRHAIVVFESMDRDGLNRNLIEDFVRDDGAQEVNKWLVVTRNHLPSLDLARSEGL